MAHPPLFVGVVSHTGTSYHSSQGSAGLAARIAASLEGARTQVNTENLSAMRGIEITRELIQESLTAELQADRAWSSYLGRDRNLRWWAGQGARWARRTMRRVSPPRASAYRRLLDIELSHHDLLRAGHDSGAPWILILEDDAESDDVRDLVSGLRGLMEDLPDHAFVNLSLSYSIKELGLMHIARPTAIPWRGSSRRRVLVTDRPVTNTVCAIAYSRGCADTLLRIWDQLPLTPIIPIDWKLNSALMHHVRTGGRPEISSWFVEPPPISQLSMHGPGILAA